MLSNLMPKLRLIIYKYGGASGSRHPEMFGVKTSISGEMSYQYFNSGQEVIERINCMSLHVLRGKADYDPNLPREDKMAFEKARILKIGALGKQTMCKINVGF